MNRIRLIKFIIIFEYHIRSSVYITKNVGNNSLGFEICGI